MSYNGRVLQICLYFDLFPFFTAPRKKNKQFPHTIANAPEACRVSISEFVETIVDTRSQLEAVTIVANHAQKRC